MTLQENNILASNFSVGHRRQLRPFRVGRCHAIIWNFSFSFENNRVGLAEATLGGTNI